MSRIYYPQARAILQVVFDGFGTTARDTPPQIIPILLKSATYHGNSYNQADSFEIKFDGGDLPFDPAIIRSGAVEVYIFQTNGILPQQQVLSRESPAIEDPTGYQPRDAFDQIGVEMGQAKAVERFKSGNKPTIVGLFDEAGIDMGEDGKWVTISGQDYTDYLMRKQWPPTAQGRARRIPTGRRIDITIQNILSEADPEGRLAVVVRGIEASKLPIVGDKLVRSHARGIPVQQDTSYWDVIYKLADRHGLTCYVDGLDVVLSAGKNLTEDQAGRVRVFSWGVNISSLSMSRKLGKEKVPTIVVRGSDPHGRPIEAQWPPNGGLKEVVKKHGKNTLITKLKAPPRKPRRVSKKKLPPVKSITQSEEYTIIPAHGISNPDILLQMAQRYYLQRGIAERKCVLRTKDLKDLRESDLLSVKAGDAVSVDFQDFNAEYINNPKISSGEKVDYLVRRGYNRSVAKFVADSYQKLAILSRPLRVREVTIDYDAEARVNVELELVDFITIEGAREAGNRPKRRDRVLTKDKAKRMAR